MLRELNLNEMNLVSGGAEAGSGDEIIVTGTRIKDTGSGTGFQKNPEGLMVVASYGAGATIAASTFSVISDLNSQGIDGVVPPLPPTPQITPTAEEIKEAEKKAHQACVTAAGERLFEAVSQFPPTGPNYASAFGRFFSDFRNCGPAPE